MSRAWIWGAVTALFAGLLAFVPAAHADRQVNLIAVGDFGARAATRTVLDGIAAASPDAAFALGDLSYRDKATEAEWCDYVKTSLGAAFPFELVAGNHDTLENPDGDIDKFAACLPNRVGGLSGQYGKEYYLDFPSAADPLVRVIAASPALKFSDGTWNYKAGDAHYQWLSAAIDDGRAAGAKWIVVAAHKSCWSVGEHACPSNTDFYNLMLSKKVDLVTLAHEHGYMRSQQLVSGVSGCSVVPVGSFDADCVADSDGTFTAGAGTIFAVVGTGGTPIRNVNLADPEAGYFAATSGANLNPAYGYLDLQFGESAINAHFVTTSGGPFADSFAIGAGGAPANVPPVAAFSSSVGGLRVDVDGGGSSDPDGSVAGYSWSWGDGSAAGSGVSASHTYTAGGMYSVKLTVTDDDGASASTAKSVTVSGGGGGATVFASDDFSRSVSSGFGSAPTGGSYGLLGAASQYSVDGSSGVMTLSPSSSRRAVLAGASAAAAESSVAVGYSGALSGGGMYVALMPKVKADDSGYRAKVTVSASGVAKLSLTRISGGESGLASWSGSVAGFTSAKRIIVRSEVTGSGPTTIRAKMWLEGTAEPSGWQVQATDSTSALQGSGGVGVFAYQSGSASGQVKVRLDDLTSSDIGAGGGVPANKPPVATFSSSSDGLRVDVDGGGSSDPDGSVAGYSWSWGDGSAAGSGAAGSHTYATGGTYSITLTVTDSDGASTSTSKSVPVSDGGGTGGGGTVFASDDFSRTVSSGFGSAPTGGAYTLLGAASQYAVDGSSGVMTLLPSSSRRAVLAGASSGDADVSVAVGYSGTLTGGGAYVALMPKVKPDNSGYRAKVTVAASGAATLTLTRVASGSPEKGLASWSGSVSGFTSAKRMIVRSEVTGSGPTTIRAKMWLEGSAEPSGWQVQATDSTSALQGPGGVGVFAYQSGSASGQIQVRLDDLTSKEL